MHSADPIKTKPQASATRSKLGFASALLALSLAAIYSPVIGGDIYKSVDKDGNTIFTDRPSEGAENLSGAGPANPLPTGPDEFLPVTVVEILSPIHDAILINPAGKTWVELQSYPTSLKKSGYTAELWMNGQLVDSGKRPMLSLPRLERGTYTLQVKLVNESGQLHLSSEIISIHIRVSP